MPLTKESRAAHRMMRDNFGKDAASNFEIGYGWGLADAMAKSVEKKNADAAAEHLTPQDIRPLARYAERYAKPQPFRAEGGAP